jgi:hypothetical protein
MTFFYLSEIPFTVVASELVCYVIMMITIASESQHPIHLISSRWFQI